MVFVQRSKSENSLPSDTFQIGSLHIAVWIATNSNGRKRFHYKFSRVGPEGQYYKLLTIAELKLLPIAVGVLAGVCRSIPTLDGMLKDELQQLAVLMTEVELRLGSNEELQEGTNSGQRVVTR